jgi:hypothetical protein
MPLHIECEEHFAEVMKFATANGCEPVLQNRLARLKEMAGDDICYLHSDFAPLSFSFGIQPCNSQKWRLIGGLIYSGPGQRLDGSGPAYTVSVEPHSNEHSWSIHT